MITVWGSLMFKMADWVHPTGGEVLAILNAQVICSWGFSPIPHRHWWIRGEPNVMGPGRILSFLIWESLGDAGSFIRQLQLLLNMVASVSGVLEQGLLLGYP